MGAVVDHVECWSAGGAVVTGAGGVAQSSLHNKRRSKPSQ